MSHSLSKKAAATTVAGFALATIFTLGVGDIANAAPPPPHDTTNFAYQVDTGDVCREQYERSDAWVQNQAFKFDNYSLQCYGVETGWPQAVSWPHLGNLKIQAYCDKFYNDSKAKAIGKFADPTKNWFCVYN